jgi:hypothetical protein
LRESRFRVKPYGVLCRPFGTRLINLILPGTDVPGYRLFRPFGTGLVAVMSAPSFALLAKGGMPLLHPRPFRNLLRMGHPILCGRASRSSGLRLYCPREIYCNGSTAGLGSFLAERRRPHKTVTEVFPHFDDQTKKGGRLTLGGSRQHIRGSDFPRIRINNSSPAQAQYNQPGSVAGSQQ